MDVLGPFPRGIIGGKCKAEHTVSEPHVQRRMVPLFIRSATIPSILAVDGGVGNV